MTKLYEHPDFYDAITAAKNYFNHPGLTEQLIEKDYYVTEALRIVANLYPNQVIFKGGTSLSKGWQLIERFSEDVDLFLNRDAFNPRLSRSKVDNKLKEIEDSITENLNLTCDRYQRKREVYRNSYFSYPQQFSLNNVIANRIFLEIGTRSGYYPTEIVNLSSYITQFLRETGNTLDTEDESTFPMLLLHFRRTFVEKLFAIHSKVVKSQKDGSVIGTNARHYYDLFFLAQTPEVQAMLRSEEYNDIKQDCDRIGKEKFKKDYIEPPDKMKFANSIALFPTGDIRKIISRDYKEQCQNLCYGDYPSWKEIEAYFEEFKELL
ncbi:MAG: nucleotidyl transferase AbiEii/AbiGii toxin family protein [Spirulina sp.]